MIQKNSITNSSDNCGILKCNVFHVYKGSFGKFAYPGDFLKISAREVHPESKLKKKSKHKSVLLRSIYKNKKKDGSFIFFENNDIVILKKRLSPRGKLISGPVSRLIRRKKFLSSFKKSI